MLRFKKDDICVTVPPYRPNVFVITSVDASRPKNAYTAVDPATGKTFRLADEALRKIGVVTEEDGAGEVQAPLESRAFEDGVERAKFEAIHAPESDRSRWTLLAQAKQGDMIKAHVRGRLQMLKLEHVLARGEKYVFLASNDHGTCYKYPLRCLEIDPD